MAEPNTVASPQTPAAPPKEALKKVTLGRKKRKLGPIFWVIGLVAVGFAFWYFFIRTAPPPPLIIRYAAVDTGSITRSVTATGTLQATTTVSVGSQVSGLVKRIFVDYNAKVKAGQLLAMLDTAPYIASLTQAAATVTKARSDLMLAVANEARERELLVQHLVAQSDYDASINALKDAHATLDVDSAQYEQAKVNLGYCYVRSPVAGVVQARDVDSGQTVAAGLNVTVLYVIAQDLTQMQVAADVDEADIGQVADSQLVEFTVEAYPGEKFEGTVWQVRINPIVTTNVVTYSVVINTPNPDGKLLPGMTATVNIINASRSNAMRVPVSATRFVPPTDLLAQLPQNERDSARAHRGQRGGAAISGTPGDSSHRHGGMSGAGSHKEAGPGAVQPSFGTIYVKTNTPDGPQIKSVHVVTGLQDANYAEVLHSNPQLNVGDSVIVAAFSLAPTSSSSSPLSQPRPGGGGGRPGGR
jgi:HlyD family secretion protein